jgi:hypothetical protein
MSADAAFFSSYIWRGQTITDAAVFEPEVSASFKNFTVSIWANQNLGGNGRLIELDYIFDYTINIDNLQKLIRGSSEAPFNILNASLGFTIYTFPHMDGDDFDSYEAYIGIFGDVLLNPFVTFYYDFDNGEGGYLEFGIRQSITPKDVNIDIAYLSDVSLDLGLTTGVNFGQWEYDASFTNMLFSLGFTVPMVKYFSASPTFAYSFALDDQYDSEFYSGIKLSVSY